ncbi:hypothetical protein HJC23_002058 [Cyclotella cryptica]|uniref:Ankyrin repeat protein n=1 Tax=Cyclotella cryptica TaxID=29204 RepID=A0ABD3Q7X7_9STRA|eukprot:CCRYP_008302-RA/>CCRYP_008302-RA protein AED:0.00 eAED:0.00 QI:150/-1/1/1/-1/1/1/2017/643
MVRLGRMRSKQQHGAPHFRGQNNMNDNMSYITDVSSVTNPIELGPTYSHESAGDEDVSFFTETEVSSALTGWTSIADQMTPSAMMPPKRSGKEVIDGASTLSPIVEPKASIDELSIVHDVSDDGSVEASLLTGKLNAAKKGESWNPRPMTIDATKGNSKPPRPPSKAVQFLSPTNENDSTHNKASANKETAQQPSSPKSVLKSKTPGPIVNERESKVNVPPSPTASISSAQKKRLPVPPLKDPTMDDNEDDEDAMWEQDCNYDINPTVMFQMLESGDWRECIEFLDGKSSENDTWNFKALIEKGIGGGEKKPDVDKMKTRQKELRSQARTWIVRRETTGVLRWRMLPIHAALVFNAPFDVVLRLYHLYPGAIRCRNDLGMLPLHHVFMYGNEDRILELFLDVFPEALTVVDDKGRLPLGCTPQDGSDNERRSNILDLYAKFHVELARKSIEDAKKNEEAGSSKEMAGINTGPKKISDNIMITAHRPGYLQEYMPQTSIQQRQPMQPLQHTNVPLSYPPASPNPEASLGIAPRYTMAADFNHVTFDSIKVPPKKTQDPLTMVPPNKISPPDIDDDKSLSSIDKYASMSDEAENDATRSNLRSQLLKLGGLDTIHEDSPDQKRGGVKKVKKGLKKFFNKRATASI